jgi:hypothetical protein
VGKDTFGWDRYLNQILYHSKDWKSLRDEIIIRDAGLDLGMDGYEIGSKIIVHHMNPLEVSDVIDLSDYVLNPEYLICTSFITHQAIHYGDESLLITEPVYRFTGDTALW